MCIRDSQKEVADRLAAVPSTKDYGRLTVMTQWLCDVKIQFNISRKAFVPPPKVISSVVTLVPRDIPLAPASWAALEKVTSAAFSQRRKMLKSSLKGFNFNFSACNRKVFSKHWAEKSLAFFITFSEAYKHFIVEVVSMFLGISSSRFG